MPKDIELWHKQKGFAEIGYHRVIYKNNKGVWISASGRDENKTGAHCKGFNTGTLGICVTGDYTKEKPEQEAVNLLIESLVTWCKKYGISPNDIFGHKEKGVTKTLCPGTYLFVMIPEIKEHIAKSL